MRSPSESTTSRSGSIASKRRLVHVPADCPDRRPERLELGERLADGEVAGMQDEVGSP